MKHKKISIKRMLVYIFALIAALVIIVPLLWLLMSSFKSNNEIFENPWALPKVFDIKNYIEAWFAGSIGTYFINTLFYSVVGVILALLFSAMAGFAFSRFNYKLTKWLFPFLLSGSMIPMISIIIPLWQMLAKIGLLDSYTGIIIVYAASSISFSVLILTGSMRNIPKAIEESAVVDGCGVIQIFTKIFLPLSKPSLVTVGTIIFIRLWNDFLVALVLNSKSKYYTLAVGLKAFVGEHSINYGQLSAGLMLAIVPPVMLYIILQKQIVEGITSGAVKG